MARTARTPVSAGEARQHPQPAVAISPAHEPPPHSNQVQVVGRLSAVADETPMPSGDLLVSFRVVVQRSAAERAPGPHAATVDVLDCRALRPGVRRTLRGLRLGDVISVRGSIRRRFFRGGDGLSSRYEIEVAELRRLYRPG